LVIGRRRLSWPQRLFNHSGAAREAAITNHQPPTTNHRLARATAEP